MRALVIGLVGCTVACWSGPAPAPPAPPVRPAELVLEVTPGNLGARPAGELPELVVAIVNRSATRTFVLPRPGVNAWLGGAAPLRYTYEQARPDGTWEALSLSFFLGHPLADEVPGESIVLRPGGRAVLVDGIPPLAFPEDFIGRMRARLVYDVAAEVARLPRDDSAGDAGKTITSNPIEIDQVPGPLELRLETIAPVAIGRELDPSTIFRVTLRNRSARELTVYGPGGITAGVGFDLDQPNGGEWPKGDRPVMELAPEPAQTRLLRPGEAIEIYGPNPALGPTPASWRYPVAETFRIRAMFSQPGRPHIHYSNWVVVTAR